MTILLDKDTALGLDITDFVQVSSYTNNSGRDLVVTSQVQLSAIVAGGSYALQNYLDNFRLAPDSSVTVPAGSTSAVLQSRQVILESGMTMTTQIKGLAGDTAVDVVAQVVDVGPTTAAELYGPQGIIVDHDYGGVDSYQVVDDFGAGISGVSITAFLTADYDAGSRGQAFIKARSSTGVDGRWREPIQLDAAAYTLLFSKAGSYQTKAISVTVA